ncbi:transmembrane protein FAM155A-like [Leptonychotes weddellii]|uniref:Transmembrane protein FAM155A-like n=1 Tax=Leptonychotes weddellii TaxID=9713 RepID=A0A7F8RLH2_LEPWE|nr:transmembrane protein FAM155A-like [Leptonychotes weddellii]
MSCIRDRTLVIPPDFLFFSFFRLSTKPGCVPSTLKSLSLTAERQFLASNTVWRFRRGVRLYCPTTMKSSTGDSPASSVQEKVKFTFECLRRNEYWLYETFLTTEDPECCDIRREERPSKPSRGTLGTSSPCHRTSLTVSSAARLGNSRLKLCVLVLILLHTVLTASAAQNSTTLGLGGIHALEESSPRDE